MSDDLMQNNQRCQASHQTSKTEGCLPSHNVSPTADTETSPELAKAVNPGTNKQEHTDRQPQIRAALSRGENTQQISETAEIKQRSTIAATGPKIDPYADFVQTEKKSLLGRLTSGFKGAMDTLSKARNAVAAKFDQITSSIGETYTSAKNSVTQAVASLIPEPIKLGFSKMQAGLKAFVNNPISSIVSGFSTIVKTAVRAATSAMKMLGLASEAAQAADTIQAALAQESAREERERIFELTSATKMGEHLAEAEAIKKLRKASAVATFGPDKEKSVYDRVDNGPEKPKTVAQSLEDLEKSKKERDQALADLAKARDLSRFS